MRFIGLVKSLPSAFRLSPSSVPRDPEVAADTPPSAAAPFVTPPPPPEIKPPIRPPAPAPVKTELPSTAILLKQHH